MVNDDDSKIFDMPHALALFEAKRVFLNKLLPKLIKDYNLKTAIDIGCGFGFFSKYLRDLGLKLNAIDGRPDNIKEAIARHPDINFEVLNIENLPMTSLPYFDLTLAFGILYHLENPFATIRNILRMTNKICIIETMIAPFKKPISIFVEEFSGKDQGLNYCALLPSESCFLKMLFKAGFQNVYKLSSLPKHKDFRPSFFFKQRRTILIASKIPLRHDLISPVKEPEVTNRYIWYRFGLGRILENKYFTTFIKKKVKYFKKSNLLKHG